MILTRRVREIRDEIEHECQHDPEKYYQRLKASHMGLQKRGRKEGIKNELYFRIYLVGISLDDKP